MTIALNEGIRLYSGAMFDYNNPAACEVSIEDIAHALSNICRFSGHIRQFYSVAQHSVNASYIVAPGLEYEALLHDTAECFTNDIPTPLKVAVPMFKTLEGRIESAMAARFGFTHPMPDGVKTADLQMLKIEKEMLKRDTSDWQVLRGVESDSVVHLADLTFWSPQQARDLFLARFEELRP